MAVQYWVDAMAQDVADRMAVRRIKENAYAT